MDIQGASSTRMLGKALDQQMMGAAIVTGTIDRLNTAGNGLTTTVNPDYLMQKSVLSAAYAERGIGTMIDALA